MHRSVLVFASCQVLAFGFLSGTLSGDMMKDSPVTFPEKGALPAKYPPDVRTQSIPAEKEYAIFGTPQRSMKQIRVIRAEMPAGRFTPPPQDWTHLQRTKELLAGGKLTLLALGDSIVNDTMRSGWVAELQSLYPNCQIDAYVYVRGGGGCQHYKEEDRVAKYIVPRKPDLVLIGGISQRSIDDIRTVIGQIRAALPEVEFLLFTGTFGTADPREPDELARAAHSGTGPYGASLRQLAAEQRCAFLDMTSPWAEYIRSAKVHPHLFYRDRVHANEYGEQILAKIITAFFAADEFRIDEDDQRIHIKGSVIEAAIRKKGYVSGVEGGSFLDVKTGARDLGFGLDIQDWIMEPGSDAAYRDRLEGDLAYDYNNLFHGKRPKRSVEGPQICTQAKQLEPRVIDGRGFVAIEQQWQYRIAAPGRNSGSLWKQTLIFPNGRRYFYSANRVVSRNSGDALFFRHDLPGHIKHNKGDTFSEIYLSYAGRIPAAEFLTDFAPDEKFNYRRDRDGVPQRMIRAYRIRDLKNDRDGPWLAGMTLNPADTSEAWCHQRGYVCLIHEVGERPVAEGETLGAVFLIGFFDSFDEMNQVYDEHLGFSGIELAPEGWRLMRRALP